MNAMEIERSHELNAQSHRILVIDDNPSIHEDFRKILSPAAVADDLAEDEAAIYGQAEIVTELAHFEIDSAHQGREGLAMVEKAQTDNRPYSMAFVDVRMPPGWDGIESIQQIWKHCPDLQMVICTAYSDYSCEEIIKTLGKSDNLLILKKPFDNAEVLQIAYAMTKKWVVTCQARFRLQNLESVVECRTMELVRANRQLSEEVKRRTDAEKELREVVETLRSSEEHLRLAGQVMIGKTVTVLLPPDRALEERDILDQLGKGDGIKYMETRRVRKDGVHIDVRVTVSQIKDAEGRIVGGSKIARDITQSKLAEFELEHTHNQLLASSRQAGMAEIATNILHDVNNVICSVNLASSMLGKTLQKSKAASILKVVTMLHEHDQDLGSFFTNDPKGKQLPGHLAELAAQMACEHGAALEQLAQLEKNIEHIKRVVSAQQSLAKVSANTEVIQINDLVEEALHIVASTVTQPKLEIIREFAHLGPLSIERHKLMQILVNLVRNAIQACEGSTTQEKRLTIRLSQAAGRVCVAVTDSGSGISPENLPRIFAHGFTTKKDGHGFGLHSAAMAAKEMGGSLTVRSEGLGLGATFTLEFPINRE